MLDLINFNFKSAKIPLKANSKPDSKSQFGEYQAKSLSPSGVARFAFRQAMANFPPAKKS